MTAALYSFARINLRSIHSMIQPQYLSEADRILAIVCCCMSECIFVICKGLGSEQVRVCYRCG